MINENDPQYLFDIVSALWIQYCSVCQEISLLIHKWKYFSESMGIFLPHINEIENRVNDLIEKTDDIFRDQSNLIKTETPDRDKYKTPSDLRMLEKIFLVLVTYLGLLKLSFYQRTVSLEIPSIIEGIPHSPEISIGNELQYIAADALAREYYGSIAKPQGFDWDGFISFVYPTVQQYFGGAFLPIKDLGIFHVVISEETKNYIAHYALLAHEFAHLLLLPESKSSIDKPLWLEKLNAFIYTDFNKDVLSVERPTSPLCDSCEINNLFKAFEEKSYKFLELFEECFCDLVAYQIGGMCTIRSLVDHASMFHETAFRVSFVKGFLNKKNQDRNLMEVECTKLKISYGTYGVQRGYVECQWFSECLGSLFEAGDWVGKLFKDYNKGLFQKIFEQEGKPRNKEECKKILELNCKENSCENKCPTLMSQLVVRKYRPWKRTRVQASDQLHKGILAKYHDPRIIIDALYYNLRSNDDSDSLVVLYSLIASSKQLKIRH